ncbi:hypothetical protein F070042J6_46180 [Bacteroides sp. f07]|uniref:RNA polymerase sigma factor n=1 Tax=Bacteroides sp. f07 TaxID=3132704 RepID=UPI0034B45B72
MNEVKTNDDKQLLEALGKGDHKAFDCIFRKYYVDVVMFCGRFMDRVEDCEDISQSLFLHIWDMREMITVHIKFQVISLEKCPEYVS